MGIPIDNQGELKHAVIDMSHQEMSRLVSHIEEMWEGYCTDGQGNSNGCEWLPVDQVGNMLCHELGYEDVSELEDALKGTFTDFLDNLPHVNKKVENGKTYFQLKPEPPRDQWRATKMTLKINSTDDLWRVCLKSPYARIEIPELEFEISQDGKRHTDSIYNHIGAAVYNLGNYVQQSNSGLSDDHKNKIMDTVIALNCFLDVPVSWTWIVHDPSGLSEFKPMDNSVVVEYEQQQQPVDAQPQQQQQEQPEPEQEQEQQ